jgi:DNA-binding transcriptional ArsR family regulator
MLSLLTGTALSAAEIARELGITQANASYHLRVLSRAGEVVAAGEESIRGGIAKRYRHPWQGHEAERPADTGRRSPEGQAAFLRALMQELLRRNAARLPDSAGLTTDADLWVEPEVWQEVLELVRTASELVHEQAKPPRSPRTIHVNLTAILFQLNDLERS